ncbi:hypothetical protein EVB41_046 [Rhizobium phage RHph_TM3_14A]|nr:hypothetical protein EVB29_046 [Rhizobium phage RHph_TM27A]QIG66966.1 hypothetical protein EVB30_046 [Rhizobium phage RHph_TM27B]QIG67055.1 hypothetical protein EVB31_045 [Rhizobium phage RHph_TM29]QIG67511.1 hypothetical protein EVB41_046 [Rhizobium phage RHph_TM3_14A]
MAKSKKTRKEFNTMAMLLGMAYDPHDHTFLESSPNDKLDYIAIYDADTMERWDYREYMQDTIFDQRLKAVKAGTLGCADGPFSILEENEP